VCGNDRHLKSTVEQWAAQAATLRENDLLLLAVAEPQGVVKHLGPALRKLPTVPPTYLAEETRALQKLRRLLWDKPEEVRDRVLNAARILKVDAVDAGSPEFDLAAAMLEGTVVGPSFGPHAMRALSQSMHTQAGTASASTIDDWVRVLRAASVTVYADRRGPAGAVVRERQAALEEHSERLGRLCGHLDLSLLADDLPPLYVDTLASDLQVSFGKPLLSVARRWPRMLLVGLPGSGKSLALRQLAGTWARDSRAPIPVLVSLRTIAVRCPRPGSLTLGVLCEVAAEDAPLHLRTSLALALEDLCRRGKAVLLLDGLDECLDRQALVADGLGALLEPLPPGTGVIIATRSSGERAARRIGLPAAELARPSGLDRVLRQLLEHVAAIRVAERDRPAWVTSRTRWLEQARDKYSGMSDIPLLATLLVLVAANTSDDRLPASQANLLMTAVQDSVRRWERQRTETADRTDWPTDGQILDGYAAIGHLLANAGEMSSAEAMAGVSKMLYERWGLAAGPAMEAAERILWFWDVHVGVFVRADGDVVVPRSRVFTEIASAMWISQRSEHVITEWVAKSLRDPEREETLQLAAELHPQVIAALLAVDDPALLQTSALIVTKAIENGAILQPPQLRILADRLAAGAAQATGIRGAADGSEHEVTGSRSDHEEQDGTSWACGRELARLPLPAELRGRRRDVLSKLPFTSAQRAIANALCALSDAVTSYQPLDSADEDAVRHALNLPLPEKPKSRRSARAGFVVASGLWLVTGHVEVAMGAARHLGNLDDDLARRIHDIGYRSSFLVYPQVLQALADRGHHIAPPGEDERHRSVQRHLAAWNSHPELSLLEAAAKLSGDDTAPSSADTWRLSLLCDLFTALGISTVAAPDFLTAATSDTDETRNIWIRCAVAALGLDPAAVAAQAGLAISEVNGAPGTRSIIELLLTRPSGESPELNPARLGPGDHSALIGLLGARSEWIADTSCQMLCQPRNEQLRKDLLAVLPGLPALRRRNAAYLVSFTASNPIQSAAELLNQPDPAARAGAAHLLGGLETPDTEARALLANVGMDADLTIRIAARQRFATSHPAALTWSCLLCAGYNDLSDTDCRHCHSGTHPGRSDPQPAAHGRDGTEQPGPR